MASEGSRANRARAAARVAGAARVEGRHGQRVHDRFGLLLVLLAAVFITLGLGSGGWQRVLTAVFQTAALAVAFLATGVVTSRLGLALLALAGLASAVLTSQTPGQSVAYGVSSLLGCTVVLAMLVSVLMRVLRHRRVTIQTLFGALCAYVLIGFLFAGIYGVFSGFGSQPLFGQSVPRSVYSYFSFVTLTTVGFGDYTVHVEIARRFVAMEAVLGQVFIATTLARLVALYKASSDPGEPAPSEPARSD
ncbi:MAG TPA: ion channel [Acidimicrobiales bacterium]|nr:ion channel [Acidimicrobiales bacterium]